MNALTEATTTQTSPLVDEALCHDVHSALVATGYPQLERVTVTAHEGFVLLRGQVSTYFEKQLAQSIAMQTDGVGSLKNEIEVI